MSALHKLETKAKGENSFLSLTPQARAGVWAQLQALGSCMLPAGLTAASEKEWNIRTVSGNHL